MVALSISVLFLMANFYCNKNMKLFLCFLSFHRVGEFVI